MANLQVNDGLRLSDEDYCHLIEPLALAPRIENPIDG